MDLNELKQKLAQCERQQQQLWAYRPLSQETLKSLREYYRVGLTYTSNALEVQIMFCHNCLSNLFCNVTYFDTIRKIVFCVYF